MAKKKPPRGRARRVRRPRLDPRLDPRLVAQIDQLMLLGLACLLEMGATALQQQEQKQDVAAA